jgi:ornithine cyclodeaminase/alanine dehydrogenase-like protein (mu-crystallin family)
MAILLTEAEVERLLPMPVALDAVEAAFLRAGRGEATNQPRRRVRARRGMLHWMGAALPEEGVLGYKAYTTFPGRVRFHFFLHDAGTGELLAVMEADRLGQRRTGAASGVATKYLAREDAGVVACLGAGWQAESQLEAVCLARPPHEARVFSRDPERRRAFCERMGAALGIEVRPVESARAAVEGAQIVITATSAAQPVLEGEWLSPGAHVNAMGSNSLLKREIDLETVRVSDLVVVDARDHIPLESGDLLEALERGVLYPEAIRELGEVVAGRQVGRASPEQITLFKSHGLALEDVAAGARVYEAAKAAGIGQPLPF